MSFPVILVDSTNGAKSDTACSGAGPATAKTGAAASSTTTTNIDITDTVDLSGVSTAGDAVIYFADTTAGHRRFARITNVTGGPSGSTWHITLDANSPVTTTVGPFSWAIGGVRATIGGTVSALLFNNNAAAGDAMPGWTVQMQSGHAETITTAITPKRSGDTTSGRITLSGTGTMPVLTFNTSNAIAIDFSAINYLTLSGFKLVSNNASQTYAIKAAGNNSATIQGVVIAQGTQVWGSSGNHAGIDCSVAIGIVIRDCDISGTYNGINAPGGSYSAKIYNNYIHGVANIGMFLQDGSGSVYGNVIRSSGARGIDFTANQNEFRPWVFFFNTIDNSTLDGMRITSTGNNIYALGIVNNIFSNNGNYGLNFSAVSDLTLAGFGVQVLGNQTYLNTSGAYHSTTGAYNYNTCPWASGDINLNPTYTSTGGNDFSIGTNLKAQGYPLGGTLPVGTTSSTYSYVDPGAAQRQEPAGGGGTVAQITGARSIGTY